MTGYLLFLSLFLSASFLTAAPFPVDLLDRFAEETLKKEEVPGAVVVLIQDDKVLLIKGYGVREKGKTAPINEKTLFQLASVTKTFTAAACGLLVDQKLLGWDREVIRNFPSFVLSDLYATRYSTPRDLLAHRTGLPAFAGDLLGKLGYTDLEVIKRVREIPFKGSFRQEAQYSNVAFFLAGELCAQAAKKPYTSILEEGFFKPLQMNRTGFSDLLQDENRASAHVEIDGKIEVIPHDAKDTFIADGGVVSCGEDIVHWLSLFLNKGKHQGKTILSQETMTELLRPAMIASASFSETAPITASPYFAYSLGWNNYQYRDQLVIEKGGALDGVRTVITLLPDLNLAIAVFCNLNLSLYPEMVRAQFLELAAGATDQNLQQEIAAQNEQIKKLLAKPKPPENSLPIAHNLDTFTGRYLSPLYGIFTIEKTGNRLSLFAGPAGFKGTLNPLSNDTFLLNWPLINSGYQEITFTFSPEGKAIRISTETLGDFTRAGD